MKFGVRELLFVVLLLAIPTSAYIWVFKPSNERTEMQRQEIQVKAQKLTSLQRALVGIKDLNEEVEKLQKAVSFFKDKLPKHHEIHRVLKQLTKIAAKHRLDTKLFKTLDPKPGSAYSEQPIKMEVSGNFHSYYEFILDLEKLPRITKVRKMKLEKVNTNGSMKADLELSIYFDSAGEQSGSAGD
jgi:type IV pilus assembly protein PilO